MINNLLVTHQSTAHVSRKQDEIVSEKVETSVNASMIGTHINWLSDIIQQRTTTAGDIPLISGELECVDLKDDRLAALIQKFDLGIAERMVLALCIVSNLKPELLDRFLVVNPETEKMHRQYGGVINRRSLRFQPTLRTAIFLLSGNDTDQFLYYQSQLRANNVLFR
jgi:hypothetical protein